ncbi:unnamed protein product [Cuscuta europaea]|uniref:Uncharacterized protein n=1 Tax=Cuscuta europaea TaxID=41803 RepID=A0A9P1ECL4_CUSEU|nr:unnamed protein product [Cuscuta europaea]
MTGLAANGTEIKMRDKGWVSGKVWGQCDREEVGEGAGEVAGSGSDREEVGEGTGEVVGGGSDRVGVRLRAVEEGLWRWMEDGDGLGSQGSWGVTAYHNGGPGVQPEQPKGPRLSDQGRMDVRFQSWAGPWGGGGGGGSGGGRPE